MPIPSMPILSHCSKNLTRNFAERQSNHLEKWDSITWSISSLMVDLTAVPADSTIAASGACTDPRGWRWRPHHRHSCVDTGRHAHFAAGGGGARWDDAAWLAERDRPLHRLGEIERSSHCAHGLPPPPPPHMYRHGALLWQVLLHDAYVVGRTLGGAHGITVPPPLPGAAAAAGVMPGDRKSRAHRADAQTSSTSSSSDPPPRSQLKQPAALMREAQAAAAQGHQPKKWAGPPCRCAGTRDGVVSQIHDARVPT
jgi:hypothetical protein